MKPFVLAKTFNHKHPFVGPIFWIASVQYFIVQIIVARAWPTSFSILDHLISDLGNTACGMYSGRYVCSPLNVLMNISFVILGITMASGAVLLYQDFQKSRGSLVGFSFMAAAGIGTILVGLFPENTVGALHFIGALLAFLVGSLGMIVLGITLDISKPLRFYTLFSGAVCLIALAFFFTNTYLGIGAGGMERLASHPQTLWIIVFGAYLSRLYVRTSGKKP